MDDHITQDAQEPEVLVEVEHLSKSFGPIKAVDDISFKVHRGDVLGFLGPNAAGKSTAMRIISCFLRQDDGVVKVAGLDVRQHSLEVRQKIGYCPESAPAYGEMTVAGFLDFVADARQIPDKKRAVEEVVQATGLESVLHQSIDTISKGYKRRVGLAQALIHNPDVLILDEPTDGLDPNQKALVHNLIENLSENKCIILSTHILDEVERVCNRAVIISQGKVLVDATPEDLVAQAPNHNVIKVTLTEANDDIMDEISTQPWCKEVVRHSDTRFSVTPSDGKNHVSDVLAMLNDVEVESLQIQEGRLDDLFRTITQGVCA